MGPHAQCCPCEALIFTNVGRVGFLAIFTWAINFQLGLAINININDRQNKFEVHISKNVAKIAKFRPKIGHDAIFIRI